MFELDERGTAKERFGHSEPMSQDLAERRMGSP
jgi:hypothetical protein